MTDSTYLARLLAFYLPQYHPIPENDAWWGIGFTEWTHVKQARPLFKGHDQPHFPGELGYYDLRYPETRQAQAELAQAYGIEGFCYWHYWFGAGRQLLQQPLQAVIQSGQPDYPFCLAWANESWAGHWHGAPNRILIEQRYPKGDESAHFTAILPVLRDRRYLRVDGRLLFIVYKPHLLPEARRFTNTWREMAQVAGLSGLYLLGIATHPWEPQPAGFDGAIIHAPAAMLVAAQLGRIRRIWRRLQRRPVTLPYTAYAQRALPALTGFYDHYPSLLPNWDNTPRLGYRGIVLTGSTPDQYKALLSEAINQVNHYPPDKRLVFIKSWNEWAEGNYLEPDRQWGRAYLEATRRAVMRL
jgi:hypothetical protein